ncbi:MAG: hypothetical protein WBH56_02800 [Bacteroidota bacterium]
MKRLLLVLLLLPAQFSLAQKEVYLDEIQKAAEKGWNQYPVLIEEWKRNTRESVLWGYNAPGFPIYLASTLAFLYEETGERQHAERAASLLAEYGSLRDAVPEGYAATRIEYQDGLPSVSNFFFLAPYVRAYLRIRNSGVLDEGTKTRIENEVAESIDFIFRFPEWGGHNRAMLRAEALSYAYQAMPDNPGAPRWRKMAEAIAQDNLNHWEIEDASNYNPVWIHALFSFAEATERSEVFTSPMMRYYYEFYTKLIGPTGTIPDYGDAVWNSASGGLRFAAFFEKGAAVFKDPAYKWAASSILASVKAIRDTIGVSEAYHLSDAYRWADESVPRVRPSSLSQVVLDDVIGKKVVFRDGWEPTSTYLLLNYRDEGDEGWLDRRYLRQTISVEEEKMHHGHADGNSIVLLMSEGSVLLHDAGYRDGLPSGQYGAWRQDYFHNRLVARKDKRDKTQGLLDFLRDAGAYRHVRTHEVDFATLRDVDMSRTRLVDEKLGYQSDRTVVYVRDPGFFVVIDGVKILRSDYYTFATLWHAEKILSRGDHFYDIATDTLPGFSFPDGQSLLVYFPESYSKSEGVEPIRRHSQDEHAIYQTVSSQYKAGDTEVFVTILVPHKRGADLGELIDMFRLLETSAPYRAVGVEMNGARGKETLGLKIDLDMEVARGNERPRYLYELGKVQYGEFETDANFFHATETSKELRYSALNLLQMHHAGKTIMKALPNTHSLQLDGGPDDHVGYSKWRRWEDEIPRP